MVRKRLLPLFLLLIATSSVVLASTPVEELENQFVADQKLELLYRLSELPGDVLDKLLTAAGTKRIAEFGQRFNETDAIDPMFPMVQHQFSLVSNDTGAILYKKGGFIAQQFVVLLDRDNPKYACKYHVHWRVSTAEALKALFQNKEEYFGEFLLSGCSVIKDAS